jgi:hypothetical protein
MYQSHTQFYTPSLVYSDKTMYKEYETKNTLYDPIKNTTLTLPFFSRSTPSQGRTPQEWVKKQHPRTLRIDEVVTLHTGQESLGLRSLHNMNDV